MLFAEISDAGWTVISVVLCMLIKEYFDYRRATINSAKLESNSEKVEQVSHKQDKAEEVAKEVKATLIEVTADQNNKLADFAAKVEEVHKATNSMKDQLVAATEKEALARGGVNERQRADAEKGRTLEVLHQSVPTPITALKDEIRKVPEKTAEKVVEKLKDVEKKE